MANLRVGIRSAEIVYAERITHLLYEMVESKKIESASINKIKKGANSIDVNTIVPLLQSIDLNEIYQKGIDSGIIPLSGALIGFKIVKEMLSIIKDGIDVYDRANQIKSQMGISCKIGSMIVAKFGRSYNVTPFDTILVSATPKSVEDTLLEKNRWGEIPIAREKHMVIKHVAIFVKSPVRAVEWIGKVKYITYNPKNKKSTIFLDGKPKRIKPIPYDERWPHHNAHGTVYTTYKRIEKAKTLCDAYPSLD